MRKDQKKVVLSNGEELTLTFTFNTIIDFEEATGVNLMQAGGFSGRSPKDVRALVWALARPEHPDLTESDVGAKLGLGDLATVMTALADLMGSEAKEGVEGKPQAETARKR